MIVRQASLCGCCDHSIQVCQLQHNVERRNMYAVKSDHFVCPYWNPNTMRREKLSCNYFQGINTELNNWFQREICTVHEVSYSEESDIPRSVIPRSQICGGRIGGFYCSKIAFEIYSYPTGSLLRHPNTKIVLYCVEVF